jgi:acyl-CoA-dependent ceramide synthase
MYEERFMDLEAYWIRYPHIPLPSPVKSYYLLALAFYTTQIFILNIEAPRRDHHQMLGHHIVTVILLAVSWFTNISRFGCAILVLLDWCDIFLPVCMSPTKSNSKPDPYCIQ